MNRKNKGFTLVELLAVIVVLAIIMVLAIPSILDVLNRSKKESFYLYANSLHSKAVAKYTQDLAIDKEKTDCAVYDIKKDLDLPDTGDFDGWVRVSRTPVSNGYKTVNLSLSSSKELQTVMTCTKTCDAGANCTCNPNESYPVEEGKKSTVISKNLKENQVFCANFQIPNDDRVLVTQATQCKRFSEGTDTVTNYDYTVHLTLTNNTYAVEDAIISEDMSESNFYKEMDKFKANHKGTEIKSPSCKAGEESSIKGTTSRPTTKVGDSSSSTTTRGTSVVADPNATSTTRGTSVVADPNATSTTRETSQVSENSSTSRETSTEVTTTISAKDTSLLLRNLVVGGHDIKFDSLTFYYSIAVPYSTTSLTVTPTPMNPESQTQVIGNASLGVGENHVTVEVFDTYSGRRAYYRITVKRYGEFEEPKATTTKVVDPNTWDPESGLPDPTIEESDATLKFLNVSSYFLEFKPDVYDYTLETRGEDAIQVDYLTNSKGAIATLTGDKGISNGSQVIINVQSQNGFYRKSYTITIVEKEEQSTGTKVIRGVAIGLGATLAALLGIMYVNKNRPRIRKNSKKEQEETRTENNQEM